MNTPKPKEIELISPQAKEIKVPLMRAPTRQPMAARFLVICVVGALTLGALTLGLLRARYRYYHVVLSDGVVKGTVAKVGVRIDGRIKSIEVATGQRVDKGDILARMEDSWLQAAVERAQAESRSVAKELENEKLGIDQARRRLSLEVEQAKGQWKKASGEFEAARNNLAIMANQYDRMAGLFRLGIASRNDMDRFTMGRYRAEGMVNAAAGVLETAEASYQKATNELTGVQGREAHLEVLEGQVAVAQANLAQAKADLEDTVIRAPAAGQVLERIVEVGGSVKAGEPVMSLWLGHAWAEGWADERDLLKFDAGSPADISLSAAPGRKFSGRVEAIGLMSDKQLRPTPVRSILDSLLPPKSAKVPVRVAFSDSNCQLQLGLSARIGITKKSKPAGGAGHVNAAQSPSHKEALRISTVQPAVSSGGR